MQQVARELAREGVSVSTQFALVEALQTKHGYWAEFQAAREAILTGPPVSRQPMTEAEVAAVLRPWRGPGLDWRKHIEEHGPEPRTYAELRAEVEKLVEV